MDAPVGGHDCPRTLREFNAWFPDEAACLDYLIRLRWPGGVVCPVCGERRFWWMSEGGISARRPPDRCLDHGGDAFADRRLPLATWFQAAWYATGTKHVVSALSLQRVLGLGSYEAAWALLHKLGRAMVRPAATGSRARSRQMRSTSAAAPSASAAARTLGVSGAVGFSNDHHERRDE